MSESILAIAIELHDAVRLTEKERLRVYDTDGLELLTTSLVRLAEALECL